MNGSRLTDIGCEWTEQLRWQEHWKTRQIWRGPLRPLQIIYLQIIQVLRFYLMLYSPFNHISYLHLRILDIWHLTSNLIFLMFTTQVFVLLFMIMYMGFRYYVNIFSFGLSNSHYLDDNLSVKYKPNKSYQFLYKLLIFYVWKHLIWKYL